MSFRSIFINPGARLMKMVVYDSKAHQLRGSKLFSALSGKINSNKHIEIVPCKVGGIDSAWFTPRELKTKRVLLYLHGGGYGACSWETHRPLISMLCMEAGIKALAMNYSLAPEFPFPAALDNTMTAYRFLLDQFNASDIIIGGDSAGGGLTMATLLKIKLEGLPMPGRAFGLSPWLDLTGSGESMFTRAAMDPIIDPEAMKVWAKRYLNGADPKNPLVSPLFGDLSGLPPLLVHVGENEVLYDDAFRFTEKARNAGIEIHFRSWKRMVHVFQFLGQLMPEAMESIYDIRDFMLEENIKSVIAIKTQKR